MSRNQIAPLDISSLPPLVQREIEQLQADGYVLHKLWGNGVELRKGASFSGWRLILYLPLMILTPVMPFVARGFVSNFFGYRHRVLVTFEESAPSVLFI
jgi:hypothetical protein